MHEKAVSFLESLPHQKAMRKAPTPSISMKGGIAQTPPNGCLCFLQGKGVFLCKAVGFLFFRNELPKNG